MPQESKNLLFNPPRLTKKVARGPLGIAARGQFAHDTLSLYLREDGGVLAIQRENEDDFCLFAADHGRGNEEECLLEAVDPLALEDLLSGAGSPFAVNREGFLFLQGDDLCLQTAISGNTPPEIYPFAGEGVALGLHAARESVFVLWHNQNTGRPIFSRFSRANQEMVEEDIFPENFSYVHLESRGDRSIIFATSDAGHVAGEVDSLLTLTPEGLGQGHYLAEDVSLSLRALSPAGERLIAPGPEDGSYFLLNPRERSLDLLAPDGSLEKIAQDIDSSQAISLRAVGDKCLLLERTRLTLYGREGLLDEISLLQQKENYDRLSFSGPRALLWKWGRRQYLEIDIV